jgi:4-hydroxy-tetrahydrodipicolinate reductase
MTKVALAGAAGRMGRNIVRCAAGLPDLSICGAVESPGHPDLGRDAGEAAGIGPIGVPIGADLAPALESADVLVVFTLNAAVPGCARAACDARRALVIGTTALSDEERAVVTRCASVIPVVWAPNMSLGMNLLFAVVRRAAGVLGGAYNLSIEETHHIRKKDAPSGTAIRLGEVAAEGLGLDYAGAARHVSEEEPAPPGPGRIVVRSRRRGEVVGDHTVVFENASERLEFTHRAWNRDAFALGALRAAAWVVRQRPRLYDMQDVLGLAER